MKRVLIAALPMPANAAAAAVGQSPRRFVPIEVAYLGREIAAHPWRFLVAVMAVAIAVGTITVTRGLVHGFAVTHTQSAHGRNAYVFAASAALVDASHIPADRVAEISAAVAPFCRMGPDGPLCSPEILCATVVATASNLPPPHARGRVRGVTPTALALRPTVVFVEGRFPRHPTEVAIGPLAAQVAGLSAHSLRVGGNLTMFDRVWKIVGRFEAPGNPVESEIWVSANELAPLRGFSHLMLRLRDPPEMDGGALSATLAARPDWGLKVVGESAYLDQSRRWQADIGRSAVWLLAVMLVLGAAAAVAVVLRAAHFQRRAETETLLAVGVEPAWVEWLWVAEAAMVTLIGIALGLMVAHAADGWPIRLSVGGFRLMIGAPAVGLGLVVGSLAGLMGWLMSAPGVRQRRTGAAT